MWPAPETLQQIRALYEALPAVRANKDGPYTFDDERRDFWAVFNTEAGRRVLARIAQVCDPMPISPRDASDPGLMAFMAGQRWVMHEINRCMAGRGVSVPQDVQISDEDR